MIGLNKNVFSVQRGENGFYLSPCTIRGVERSYYDNLIKNIKYSELTNDGILYFSKTSIFPRLKLENTNFKRCIKLDKADFVVINPKTIENRIHSTYYVETTDSIYLISYYYLYYKRLELETFLGFKINQTDTIQYYELTEKRNGLIELLENPNLKFISDDLLNIAINKTDQLLDLDSAKLILDMLNASDIETIELGLKMLTGFNVNETPLTISTMLLLYNKWYMTNAKSNVLVTNMLKQLDVYNKRVGSGFPYCIKYVGNFETNDYDKTLAKSLIFEKTKLYVEQALHQDIEFFKKYNIDIKVEIE